MPVTAVTAALALLASLAAMATSGSPPAQRTVPCAEIIDSTRFPYLGGSRPQQRYRLVLGSVSVPPAYLKQIVATRERPWRYWRKAGLVVRADGTAVVISVPKAWRKRAAIAWGYGGHGPFSSLRIAGCRGDPHEGNAYSGGFYLRSSSACVPLVFRVGARSATVRFGLGRRCART
jgi:hypothetical protein